MLRRRRVRFFWSELLIGDHGDRSASPLAIAPNDVHGSLKAILSAATAVFLLGRAFLVISLKEKRTLPKVRDKIRFGVQSKFLADSRYRTPLA